MRITGEVAGGMRLDGKPSTHHVEVWHDSEIVAQVGYEDWPALFTLAEWDAFSARVRALIVFVQDQQDEASDG
jgi:hypothetical protein